MADFELSHEYDFSVTADLLAADGSNRYLVDAAGYLRATQHVIEAESYPETAAREAASTLRTVADYAASADNVDLADYVFEREDLAGRWRLYGKAAVAGTIDAHPDWLVRLESDEAQTALTKSQTATTERLIAGMRVALAEYAAIRTPSSKAQALAIARAIKSQLWAVSYWNQAKGLKFEKQLIWDRPRNLIQRLINYSQPKGYGRMLTRHTQVTLTVKSKKAISLWQKRLSEH
jgi:hypothetical protein